jgi:hypothetical protein
MPVPSVFHESWLSWQRIWSSSYSRASGASEEAAIRRKRRALLVNVFLLLLMSLLLSLSSATTKAVSSPFAMVQTSFLSSHSPSPTVTAEKSTSGNTAAVGETGATPLTFIDLVSTIVAALIPALLGSMFIVARQRSLREREQSEWAGQAFLTEETEQLDWPREEEVVDLPTKEQRDEAGDNDPQRALFPASVTSEPASSRVARLKCRLRSLPEPLPPE